MSKYSDTLKTAKRKDMEHFFGEDLKPTSGKYFTFSKVKDADNIIILSNNIKYIKDKPVLIVGENKGIYLRDWQLRKCSSFQQGINCYAVKLSRRYFTPYTFKFSFTDFKIDKEYTFDMLFEIAKEQDAENLPVKQGWLKF